jgi:hypothetical protein
MLDETNSPGGNMRSARSALTLCILILAIPSWGKQTSQTDSTVRSTSDPQAVAVVQAAITALGGATAIGQAQSWDFQGLANGPFDTGSETETIKLQLVNASIMVNGVSRPAPRFASPSLFLPILAGTILLQESQDSNYVLRFDGGSTLSSKAVTGVTFLTAGTQAIAQTWLFDAATGLPARIFFESPAQAAQTKSYRGLIDLSDYTAVSGVLYPFSVLTYAENSLPETLILQSVTPATSTLPSQSGSSTGGAQ